MKRESIAFCEECRADVSYTVEEVILEANLKGDYYQYLGKKAICDECGNELYVGAISDQNLEILYALHRQKKGLLSLEQIRALPVKYKIGRRPLSLLLGWGEMTFSRYYDGDVPTKQYSDILERLNNEPEFYLKTLQANQDKITRITYEKSRRATEALLGRNDAPVSKVTEIADYLIYQCKDVTPLALQKMLYYVQGFYFAFLDLFLFSEDCEAWTHGPVYRNIYNRYAWYHYDPIDPDEEFDVSLLTEFEKALADSVIQHLGCYSGNTLERFTHKEIPWLKTRGDLPAAEPSERIISKEFICDYFKAVKERYQMLIPNDIEKYARMMFDTM